HTPRSPPCGQPTNSLHQTGLWEGFCARRISSNQPISRRTVERAKTGFTPMRSANTPPRNGPANCERPIRPLYPATYIARRVSGVTSSKRLKAARLYPAQPNPEMRLMTTPCSGRKAPSQSVGMIAATIPEAIITFRPPNRSDKGPQYLWPKIVVMKVDPVTTPQNPAEPFN